MKNKLKTYEVPATSMARLSLESAFLAASQPVQEIGKEDVTVKVEEYDTFENQVTFEEGGLYEKAYPFGARLLRLCSGGMPEGNVRDEIRVGTPGFT